MRYEFVSAALFVLACDSQKSTTLETHESTSKSVTPPATTSTAHVNSETTAATRELTLVADFSQVCMVNNQFMGRAQIPVEVGGRTYFGCCEMCKGRLASDPATRSAKDPVNGKLVDKSSAVIAKRASGEVLYFESNATFEQYRTL